MNFNKNKDGLLPAIIQDAQTKSVLMLGYMNEEAYRKTLETKKVTFFSRSRQRLWTKGEESGNFLELESITPDCDEDTFLVLARPLGPTCHKGTDTCWGESNEPTFGFLSQLEAIIASRKNSGAGEGSYIASLFQKGINKIAQKVGEEAVELVIEAKDENPDLFLNEAADLLFHYLLLLQAKGYTLEEVAALLEKRHFNRN